MNTMAHVGGQQNEEGGTGSGFARAVTIVAGQYTHRHQSFSLSACLVCEGERQRHGDTEEQESGRETERLANRDRETAKW